MVSSARTRMVAAALGNVALWVGVVGVPLVVSFWPTAFFGGVTDLVRGGVVLLALSLVGGHVTHSTVVDPPRIPDRDYPRRDEMPVATGTAVLRDQHDPVEQTVTRLAAQAGIDPPTVTVVDDDPVAATVRCGGGSHSIVVSNGLLDRTTTEELEAVLAHELSHVLNRDSRFVQLLATARESVWFAFATLLVFPIVAGIGWVVLDSLYRQLRDLLPGSSRSWIDRSVAAFETLLAVAWCVLAVRFGQLVLLPLWETFVSGGPVALLSSVLLVAWVAVFIAGGLVVAVFDIVAGHLLAAYSRAREYFADDGAVAFTGKPGALASALETLSDAVDGRPDVDAREAAPEAIPIIPIGTMPIHLEFGSPSFHPPAECRIERLRERERQQETANAGD